MVLIFIDKYFSSGPKCFLVGVKQPWELVN